MKKFTIIFLLFILFAISACDPTEEDTVDPEKPVEQEDYFLPGDKKVGLVLSGGGA